MPSHTLPGKEPGPSAASATLTIGKTSSGPVRLSRRLRLFFSLKGSVFLGAPRGDTRLVGVWCAEADDRTSDGDGKHTASWQTRCGSGSRRRRWRWPRWRGSWRAAGRMSGTRITQRPSRPDSFYQASSSARSRSMRSMWACAAISVQRARPRDLGGYVSWASSLATRSACPVAPISV